MRLCCRKGSSAFASLATRACSSPRARSCGSWPPKCCSSSVTRGPTKRQALSSRSGLSNRSTACNIGARSPASMICAGDRFTSEQSTSHAFCSSPLSSERSTAATTASAHCHIGAAKGVSALFNNTPYKSMAEAVTIASVPSLRSVTTTGNNCASIERRRPTSLEVAQPTRSNTLRSRSGSLALRRQSSRTSGEKDASTFAMALGHIFVMTVNDSNAKCNTSSSASRNNAPKDESTPCSSSRLSRRAESSLTVRKRQKARHALIRTGNGTEGCRLAAAALSRAGTSFFSKAQTASPSLCNKAKARARKNSGAPVSPQRRPAV
mmetsp:Transcript_53879/g.149851  ORF Transcript_53879/g.149851 Transcript_53879/m.149851 type:complete len:322 (+) Transcript_53879:386-1351(+)